MKIVVKPKLAGNGKSTKFRRFFTHWRTGKIYDAWKYGYKGWPIGRGR